MPSPHALRPRLARSLLLTALVGLACDPGDARSQWLHTTIVLDNQIFLEADPELAAGKLAKMDLDRYAFFRGTVGCFARDSAEAGGAAYRPTAFVTADAADVALIGDPHLENIGTFRRASDDALVVDFNDYDATTYGPFHLDLRRLALSVAIAAAAIDEVSPGFADAVQDAPEALARGYVDELAALAQAGGTIPALRAADGPHGAILDDLIEKAAEKGGAREELSDYTAIEGGRRELRIGEIEPALAWSAGPFELAVASDEVTPIGDDDGWLIDQVLASYPATLAGAPLPAGFLAVKGIGRRLGAGVASYPVRRYYVLVEGPSAAIDDDVLLELKQVFDPVIVPDLEQAAGGRPYADNGERVVAMQRMLQGALDLDPLLGHANAGGITMRVRDRTKYQRGLGVDRIAEKSAEGKWDADDYRELAATAGRLLARAHARGRRRGGEPSLPAIAAAIGERGDALVRETVDFVADYAPVVLGDADRFGALLEGYGPSLGYLRR
ncbi:MAG: DUF2252 family protein [Myxococcales bacterium]|nr:DUF2252 family protein [Myxococcales bacterium]